MIRWIQGPPGRTGWYLSRRADEKKKSPLRVDRIVRDDAGTLVVDRTFAMPSSLKREWAGPIPETNAAGALIVAFGSGASLHVLRALAEYAGTDLDVLRALIREGVAEA